VTRRTAETARAACRSTFEAARAAGGTIWTSIWTTIWTAIPLRLAEGTTCTTAKTALRALAITVRAVLPESR
jgi:hypothetical protein